MSVAARLHGCTTRGRLHLAALAQIRRPDTEDYAYYQRCLQRGKTKREATRVPKTAHLRPHLDAPPTHKPESVSNDAFWISQRGLWVPETRPWSLTCRDRSRC